MLLPGERRRPLRDHSLPRDGPGLGGQPRLADLRARRRAGPAYPTAFGAIFSTLYDPAVRRRARDHPARHRATPCAAWCRVRARSASSARSSALSSVADAVRARRGHRRDRVRASPGRQRGRRCDRFVAESDVHLRRRARDPDERVPGRGLARRRTPRAPGSVDVADAFRRARSPAGASPARVALAGLFVVRSDARAHLRRPHRRRGARRRASHRRPRAPPRCCSCAPAAASAARWSAAVAVASDRCRLGAGAEAAAAARADRRGGRGGRRDDRRAARLTRRRRRDPDPVAGAAVRHGGTRPLRRAARAELGSLEHARARTRRHQTAHAETGRRAGVAAAVCAALGVPLTFLSDGGATLALGVVLLLAAIASAAAYVVPSVALEAATERLATTSTMMCFVSGWPLCLAEVLEAGRARSARACSR